MSETADSTPENEEVLDAIEENKEELERPHGCLTAAVVGGVLLMVTIGGGIWLQSALAGLVQTGLMVHTIVGAVYAFLLLIPFGLVTLLLRDERYGLWRGVALALAMAGGYAVVSDMVLAIDMTLDWPGLPMSVLPAVSIVFGLAALALMWRKAGILPPMWALTLGLGLALLISIPWGIAGVLGTALEAAIGLFEAAGSGLAASAIVVAIFYFDMAYLRERPFWSAVIVGFVFWATKSGLLTVRGYWLQANLVTLALIPAGFVAGMLLSASASEERPLRGSWAVFGFLTLALAMPFTFTEGFEGEWMLDQMGASWGIGAMATFGAGFLVAVASLIATRWLARSSMHWQLSGSVGFLALLGFGVPYILAGQPGMQPESFFVVMADQADTSFARDIEDRDERVTAVYDMLVEHADGTQADLRDMLDDRGVTYTSYYLVNGIEVQGSRILRWQIARRDDVARVIESPLTRPLPAFAVPSPTDNSGVTLDETLPWGIDEMDAERVWDDFDVRGEGILVGHADSGVDWTHPAIRDQYTGGIGDHDYTWFDPWEGTTEPTDSGGHGTYTLGSVLGAGGIGVAPEATWIGCRNLARNLGNPAYYLDCMQFLFAPFPLGGDPLHDGDSLRGAHVTNNSWGCPPQEGCDGLTLAIGVTNLRNAGQMMVVSAGNEGPGCGTVSAPANAHDAFSVGAVDRFGTIASFSSRGPVEVDGSGRAKPDIVAPGVDIYSSAPGGYMSSSGTSAAGPHVTGLVALIWSANPDLIGDVDATERIIIETAHWSSAQNECGGNMDGHNNVYGYGMIDAYAAVERALAIDEQ